MNKAKAVRIFMYSLLVATLIGVAIFVFFIITTVPAVPAISTVPAKDPIYPTERPLNLTKSLLDAASDPKNTTPPIDLPNDIKSVDRDCWYFLKTTLARNKNQYRLEARVYGDRGTPVYNTTGLDEIVVDVIFADRTHAEIYYYNTFLSTCQELKNGDTPLFSTPIPIPFF